MKAYHNIILVLFLSHFATADIYSQHSILGDDQSCYGECKTYTLNGGIGGPYYWKSTGDIEGSNQGNQVEICWNTIGSNTITLVDFAAPVSNQIEKLDVTVAALPKPNILPPKYPECVVRDSIKSPNGEDIQAIECLTACSESVAFYGFDSSLGSTAVWEVDGGTILSETSDGITIQWNPSGNGFIKLIETNSFGCIDSAYYCIEILEPLDVDILAFNGGLNSINVCVGQEVYLQALSSEEATLFEWTLGDDSFAYGTNISTSYEEGGIYDIMLIGATECKCFDTSYYQIIVDQNPGPEITCTGTTCGNEEHTYYAANDCGTYNWNISSNGTIIDGGGPTDDFITVDWNTGPVGTVGLSTSGCAESICADETVVQIPIMDGSATIEGPTVACKSGYSNYTVQYYNGTEYVWNINGNGTIIQGWGTNQITVEWSDSPDQSYTSEISVSYENCYLECGDQATLTVELKPEFDISYSQVACEGSTAYFNGIEGWNGAVLNWTITSPSGVEYDYPNVAYFNDVFTEIGIYTILAQDPADEFCNDEVSSFFEITETPDTPTSIDGPLVICKNQFYNYSVSNPDPNISVIWNIYDGSNFQQTRATTASIQWTSNGPYEIRVRYARDDFYCRSEEFVVQLELAENATITGTSMTCVDEVDTYSVGATNGTLPEWSVVPPDAGSIIHNPDNTIDVMWHESGSHQITSDYCGSMLSYNVDVSPLGVNDVIYDEEICPGELAAINSIVPVGSTVEIRDENDNFLGSSTSLMVPNGKYEVEITSIDGCIEVFPVVIDTFLPPTIRVSSPDENAFCLPHPEVSIVALNTKDGYTYEWFHNNLPMGQTTPTISTNQYGDYHVQVTDKNGCTAISNIHTLHEWCGGDPPSGTCTNSGDGIFGMFETNLTCNSKRFSVFGINYMSTSFTWNFGDPDSGVNNTSTEDSPIHEFTYAGYYYVFVYGNVAGEHGVDIFTVPAAPKFDYTRACAGSEVQFRNHSTFIPGHDILHYNWNFGDPTSGSDNTSSDENPTHVYDIAGFYNVTLEIESTNGCLSTYELVVEVEAGPLAEFILPPSACTNEGVLFEAFENDDIYAYEWDFDDPASGSANTSKGPEAIHTFSGTGSYNVTLSIRDANDCIQSISKTIDVTTTSLAGDITTDRTLPICYGEEVTLTAPGGGDAYIWSDGSIGQSITVSDPGIYHVTITENTGCDYIPDPINVIVEGTLDVKIRSSLIEDGFSGPLYFDSLEICQGQLFNLSTAWISGATYEWSTAHSSTYISEYDLTGLAPGRHEYRVTVTDPISGCDIESDPMLIIVNPLPTSIQVSTASSTPCEGEDHILTVDNPQPDLIYYWSNGVQGLTTTVNKGGSYSVTAINRFGCERKSNGIYIAPLPNANRINLGCTEACFPDTICIPNISGASSYQWLLDGMPIPGPVGTTRDLIASQGGEYQLVVENYHGCRDTSEVLSIDAEPSDQSVSGIVFIDDNNNGIWDAGEELLSGVTVSLFSGTILETTTITDVGGYYIFDPVDISNPNIEIDTAGLGLNLSGGIFEENITFVDCLEDKVQNFPLTKECIVSTESVDLFTCTGETIIVNSIVLQAGDTWSFDDVNVAGCDSTTFVTVYPYPDSDVNLTTVASCQDVDSGILNIAIMAGTGLQFAIDNPSNYTSGLQFTDLSPGTHMLWITDVNGCTKNYSFEIETLEAPSVNIVAQNTCINDNTGTVDIQTSGTGIYQFSLDGIIYTSSTQFTDLGVGSYSIFVQEDNSCIYEYNFTIAVSPEPQFDLQTSASCSVGASGSLQINALDMGSFEYSLDNISFVPTTTFTDLPVGTHTLYVQESNGCLHTYSFEILEAVEPELQITPTHTCDGGSEGVITISPLTSGNYEYSIDGIAYTNNIEFAGLAQGAYTIYLLEDGICEYQYPVAIEIEPIPSVVATTTDACQHESNGTVSFSGMGNNLEYSLDQITFTVDSVFEGLSVGLHTAYIRGENNCIHPVEFEIFEAGEMIVEFIDPLIECSMNAVDLSPNILQSYGDLSYAWSTGESDSTIVANNTGDYHLTVSDKCSSDEYSWNIQFEEVSQEQPIYFPNIFSPNQDGINECFLPVLGPETIVLNYHLIIFDRWGNKFFETTDLNDCWDGTYLGKDVRSGVFVYMLDLEYTYCVEVESLKKYGDVTIVH